jgi:hypothetical protein
MAGAQESVSTGLALMLVIALLAFLVVMKVLDKPIVPSEASAANVPAQQSSSATSPDPAPRDPDFVPYWYPSSRGWVVRDLWNRDPVCHGDPVCRDAYFRDWPYARRPYDSRSPSRSRQQPIQISVTSPSTATATSSPNIYVNGSSTPAEATATPSAGGPVESAEAIMEAAGLEGGADLSRPSVAHSSPPASAGLAADADALVLDAEADAPIADEAVMASAAGRRTSTRRAGGASSCTANRFGTTRCGPEPDVFPAGSDKSAYCM